MFSSDVMIDIIIRALIVGLLVSVCASLLGVSLVLKRFSMIGDGLSHVGFGAVAVAALLNLSDFEMEVSIPIVVLAAILILKLNEKSKIKGDSAIAIISTGAIAIGSLIFDATGRSSADICNSLFGTASLFTIDNSDMALSVVLSLIVVAMFVLFYTKIFAITFDESFSRSSGINVSAYNTIISVLTALIIVIGMKMIGALLISALIVFPALSAMRICKSFKSVVISSAIISVFCFITGFFGGCLLGLKTGASVVCVNIAVFIILLLISKLKIHINKKIASN